MKVARFSQVRTTVGFSSLGGGGGEVSGTDPGSGQFPPSGQIPTSTGSNTWAWGSNIATVWANGSNQLMGPHIQLAAGSNIILSLDQGPGGSYPSNTLRIHSTGGDGSVSYGSNSNQVSSANAAGASTLVSRADHVHQGVHQLASNGSNARYEDVNLVAGSGIALGVSGQDITITNVGQGHGGSGGASSTAFAPSVVSWTVIPFASTNSLAGTIPAAANGNRLIVVISSYNRDVTSVTCTNVTFTEVLSAIQGTAAYLSVYVGVVSGGASGTTLTIAAGSVDNIFATVIEVKDALTPTVVNSATKTGTSATTDQGKVVGPITTSAGNLVIFGFAVNNAAAVTAMEFNGTVLLLPPDSLHGLRVAIGSAGANSTAAYWQGGPNANYAAGIVAVS